MITSYLVRRRLTRGISRALIRFLILSQALILYLLGLLGQLIKEKIYDRIVHLKTKKQNKYDWIFHTK